MARISACHAGDRGSIPRLGVVFFLFKPPSKGKNNQKFSTESSDLITTFFIRLSILSILLNLTNTFSTTHFPFHNPDKHLRFQFQYNLIPLL